MNLADTDKLKIREIHLTDKEFDEIRAIVYSRFGIALGEQKRSLVIGRLRKLALQKGFSSFAELVDFIKKDASGLSLQEMIDRISTNHTFFFREPQHFTMLSQRVFPEIVEKLKKSGSKDLRIRCAASSTGEEPYSILMTLMEFMGKDYPLWQAGLLATDVSSRVIEIARRGIYTTDQVQNIPEKQRNCYFNRLDQDNWQFKNESRKEITFRLFNLMNPVFPFRKPFHIIFCRNVMIYFDTPTRNELINKLFQITAPGGYLFIGHSESIRGSDCPFEYVQPAVFRKRP